MAEKTRTGAQLLVVTRNTAQGMALLDKRLPATYETYRKIRKQPTVALARALTIAPVVAGEWQIEPSDYAPEDAAEFISDQLLPIREELLTTAMQHRTDYGWAAFEVVLAVEPWGETDRLQLKRLKSLLVDMTSILLDPDTGEFLGFRQDSRMGIQIDLPAEASLLLNWDVEGDHLYGQSLLENIRYNYQNWMDVNDGSERYDRKVAGANWVIHYPQGFSMWQDAETDNATIAQALLDSLESSGTAAIPTSVQAHVSDLSVAAPEWKIELLESVAHQAAFVDALSYRDKLFVRGLLTPERAILEGEYGTKAEAGVHADWALTQRDLEHRHVVRQINERIVNPLLVANWGPQAKGTVRIEASPLADVQRTFFREVYKLLLTHPTASAELIQELNLRNLSEAVGAPVVPEEQSTEGEPDASQGLMDTIGRLFKQANEPDAAQPAVP